VRFRAIRRRCRAATEGRHGEARANRNIGRSQNQLTVGVAALGFASNSRPLPPNYGEAISSAKGSCSQEALGCRSAEGAKGGSAEVAGDDGFDPLPLLGGGRSAQQIR
jgi:hypothetical protein